MTRIWLFSDLHQEFVEDTTYGSNPLTAFDPLLEAPDDFDVVVAAGDIHVPLTRSLEWLAERFSGVPVIYVPGNHDFYVEAESLDRYSMLDQIQRGLELAERLGLHLLIDRSVVLDGVRFTGGTLWTDFTTVGYGNVAGKMAQAAGRHGLSDYKRIRRVSTKTPGKLKRIRPVDTVAAHRRTRDFIERTLQTPFDGSDVVVTHHAPLRQSLGDKPGSLDFCFASHFPTLFQEPWAPEFWLHGHIHAPVDYMEGKTRVISNPRGYLFTKEERNNPFDPALVLEIPSSPAIRLTQ